jgi:hypothetical protein
LTGIKEKTALVKLGLEALIAMESAKRLAALGGTEKNLEMIYRRRVEKQQHGAGGHFSLGGTFARWNQRFGGAA